MHAVRLCSTTPPNMNFNVMSQAFSLQLYKNLNQVYKRKNHKHMYICARSMKTHAPLLSIKDQVYKTDTPRLYAALQHRWVSTPSQLHVVLDSLKFT